MTTTAAVGPRPRSVFAVNVHPPTSLERADELCDGRFHELGRTLRLGVEPDWMGADVGADVEWRIAWSKFYYGLDLAHAYRLTGRARYLRTWERLVRSWLAHVPVGWDTSDVAARRVQNWIYAWDLFATAPAFRGLSAGMADELLDGLLAQVHHIRDHLTPERNHRTLELYALFVFALAFPSADPALLDAAVAELHRNLVEETRPDGAHIEASTHYHCIVLRSFVGARENARRFGIDLPPGFDAHLARACEFAVQCHRPDGWITTFSDADDGTYLDVVALGERLLGDVPRELRASFPDAGYHVQRSGWDAGARYLMFDCGPLGAGGHGHYDLLSVEAMAGGRRLLVDPGRYTYDETPEDGVNMRHWFKGTAAHNTVCVDGTDQTPYRRSKPKGPVAEGRFLERLSAPRLDVLRASAHSPAYEAVHTRRVVFVDDAYWLIEDRLVGAGPHRYDLRFHLAPEAQDAVGLDGGTVLAPGLALVFAGTAAPRVEPGWVAPEYGVKHPAPVVAAAVDGVCEATFVTLLAPRDDGSPPPRLRVRHEDGATIAVIEDGAATDTVAWTEHDRPLRLGRLTCRAACAWLREPGGEDVPSLQACGVTDVRPVEGPPIFTARTPVEWLAWVGRDDEQVVSSA